MEVPCLLWWNDTTELRAKDIKVRKPSNPSRCNQKVHTSTRRRSPTWKLELYLSLFQSLNFMIYIFCFSRLDWPFWIHYSRLNHAGTNCHIITEWHECGHMQDHFIFKVKHVCMYGTSRSDFTEKQNRPVTSMGTSNTLYRDS